MTDRVPHVLGWLVRRRRIINGHLENALRDKARLELECRTQVRKLDLQIRALKRDLAALDATMAMQDIQVDPRRIGTTRPQVQPRRTEYGQMTSVIYKALGAVFPNSLTTHELVAVVADQCVFVPIKESEAELMRKVRKRLGHLYDEGKVARLHSARIGSREVGRWCLSAPPPGWQPEAEESGAAPQTSPMDAKAR